MEDDLPQPIFNNLISPTSLDVSIATTNFDTYASFYRTAINSNIELEVALGTDESFNGIYTSPNVYLPNGVFNSMKVSSNVTYPNNKDAQILIVSSCNHNIIIQYKITQADGTNFVNQREMRVMLVNGSYASYNSAILSASMPDTGQHTEMILNQFIDHIVDDIVKIKFLVIQDTRHNGASDSLITIFSINWTIND